MLRQQIGLQCNAFLRNFGFGFGFGLLDGLYVKFRTHSSIIHLPIKYLMSNYNELDTRGCRNKGNTVLSLRR